MRRNRQRAEAAKQKIERTRLYSEESEDIRERKERAKNTENGFSERARGHQRTSFPDAGEQTAGSGRSSVFVSVSSSIYFSYFGVK